MKKLIFLLFISNSIIAQNSESGNPKIDEGFEPLKLENKFEPNNSSIKLYGLNCGACEPKDSIAKKYQIKDPFKILLGGIIPMNDAWMYLLDNNLYKLKISYYNYGKESQAVLQFLIDRFGKENKLNGIQRVWETSKTYLSATLPEYSAYENRQGTIVLYSKKLDTIFNKRIDSLKRKTSRIEKTGKGTGMFIPDITSSVKILLSNSTITNFEKNLPTFTVSQPDTLYSYNKITDKYDLFNCLLYTYNIDYKYYGLTAEVETTKNKTLKKIEYRFQRDPGIRFALQRSQNGLIMNEKMTKLVTIMGLNNCIVYDNNQKIHLTEYTSQHFTVEKY